MPSPSPAPPPIQMPPAGGKNPYDFILDAKNAKKGSFLNVSSQKTRLLYVGIGASLLIIVGILVFSFITGGSKEQVDALVSLSQQENEIARVAAIGVEKATSGATKNFAITADLSLATNKLATVALLKRSGHDLDEKDLALKQNTETDNALNSAESANNFDDVFTKLMKSQLASYRISVQNAYRTSTSATERQLLQNSFQNATLLIGAQET